MATVSDGMRDHGQPNLKSLTDHADLDGPLEPGARMGSLKKVLKRLVRVVTHRQTVFNRTTIVVLEDLIARIDEMQVEASVLKELFERREFTDRDPNIASIRSDVTEIQQQLRFLQRGLSAFAQSETFDTRSTEGLRPANGPATADSALDAAPTGAGSQWPGVSGSQPNGPVLNVFGDWAATTGLAQAARRLTVAMLEAGFDLSLGTVRSGAPQDPSRIPERFAGTRDDRRDAPDIWLLNVNELTQISDDQLRPPGRRSYAVGVWYWELTSFPEHVLAQIERVDEIWVATAFVKAAFERVTSRPVRVVPAIVPELRGTGKETGKERSEFGLDEDEVVFLFTFDVNSMIARKNPAAVIDAFARAFDSQARTHNRLVIKVLNLELNPRFATWLADAVASVGGVLINKDLKDSELVDLLLCCDVYVSLHRSEGFGFGLAEAMALGKPVIATAYSGNLDFTTTSNSCQVGYRLTQITEADHEYDEGARAVYLPGSTWADPDAGEAARWMQLLSADPEMRRRIGEAGQATVLERNSPGAAIEAVHQHLDEILGRFAPRA
jgi:glycosyltransferase involved in cell wall biosynthesis